MQFLVDYLARDQRTLYVLQLSPHSNSAHGLFLICLGRSRSFSRVEVRFFLYKETEALFRQGFAQRNRATNLVAMFTSVTRQVSCCF